MKKIYLDYAATTPADADVLKKALPYFSSKFWNPSSQHSCGNKVKISLENARNNISEFMHCNSDEVYFTSGGTEAENLAVRGIAFSASVGMKSRHIVVSAVEHKSVLSSVNYLSEHGFEITYVPVDKNCMIDEKAFSDAIKDDTVLAICMLVNNEIGTIQPIETIGKKIKNHNIVRRKKGLRQIYFHVDAEASSVYVPIDVERMRVTSLCINGSKIYSLKGAAALYVKKDTPIATQISGGGQERLIRGGTENIPAIIALGEATSMIRRDMKYNLNHVEKLRSYFSDKIRTIDSNFRINTPKMSSPSFLHVTFHGYGHVNIVELLDKRHVYVSSGSACSANSDNRSHVLQAMNFTNAEIAASVRFSLGKSSTSTDIDYTCKVLREILKK